MQLCSQTFALQSRHWCKHIKIQTEYDDGLRRCIRRLTVNYFTRSGSEHIALAAIYFYIRPASPKLPDRRSRVNVHRPLTHDPSTQCLLSDLQRRICIWATGTDTGFTMCLYYWLLRQLAACEQSQVSLFYQNHAILKSQKSQFCPFSQ